jgi:hypothetical protein
MCSSAQRPDRYHALLDDEREDVTPERAESHSDPDLAVALRD